MAVVISDNGVQFADNSVLSAIPRSILAGLTMSTAGSSTTMSIAVGQAANSTNAVTMNLAAAISKTTAAWAVGTAVGGLDTGTIANSTWYHYYVIRRPDTGVVDAVFSTNATSPTLPTNYTQFRRIGSGRTDGSGQWQSFNQVGNEFLYLNAVLDADVDNPGTSGVLRTLSVPTGVKVLAKFIAMKVGAGPGLGGDTYFSSPDQADVAGASATAPLMQLAHADSSITTFLFAELSIRTNTTAQIRTRATQSGAGVKLRIATFGWIDTRGRDL